MMYVSSAPPGLPYVMAKLTRAKRLALRALIFVSNLKPGAVVVILLLGLGYGLALALGTLR
jgi:hypothetical protein